MTLQGECIDSVGELPTTVVTRAIEVTSIASEATVRERAIVFSDWMAQRLANHAPVLSTEYEQYWAWSMRQRCIPVDRDLWWNTLRAITGPTVVTKQAGHSRRASRFPRAPLGLVDNAQPEGGEACEKTNVNG